MLSVVSDPAEPGLPPEEVARLRRELRKAGIAAREALAAPQHASLNAALAARLDGLLARLQPACIGFCWPHRAEPDLRACVSAWLAGDPRRTAALPEVRDPPLPMRFRQWHPHARLAADRHGIPTPVDSPVVQPDVLLVPLNAFDAAGYRIGYGGGYFDRTLAALEPPPLAIGIGFELGRAPTTWPQAHDRPMDWIVTEAGVWAAAG